MESKRVFFVAQIASLTKETRLQIQIMRKVGSFPHLRHGEVRILKTCCAGWYPSKMDREMGVEV